MEADIFEGCSSLAELSIPFVGETKDATKNNTLGFLFVKNVPNSLSKLTITNAESIAKDAFFAFPSYYNEDTKKYSNQVYIPKDNEGLKDDLNEFVKYAIADAKLLDL